MPSGSISHLRVGTAIIEPVNEVRDLGFTLDSSLTLCTHIKNINYVDPAHYLYTNLVKSGNLYQKNTKRVVHAFFSPKLDYCNGLFYGLPSSKIQKLQRLQNSAILLITRAKI